MDRLALKLVLEVPDLQVRAPRDGAAVQADVVRRYADLLLEGVEFPPVLVMRVATGLPQVMVLDGRHRLAAHRLAGCEDIAVEYSEAKDMRAGLEVALKANGAHGLPRSREDLRHCIGLADKLWPEVSDREIARRLGCGHSWVSEVRRKAAPVLAVECPVPDTEASTSKLHEGSEGQMVVRVDHGSEPRAQVVAAQEPRFAAQTIVLKVEDAEGYAPVMLEPRSAEAAWVEDVDRELAGMGPGRVLLASGEVEVPVAREVKRHRGQDPLERWYTDPALATVCWRWLLGLRLVKARKGVIQALEPAVGDGVWITAAAVVAAQMEERLVIGWEACDLDPNAKGEGLVGTLIDDFLEVSWARTFDLVITNPPNSRAFEFVKRALELVAPDGVVAFLMPLSWYAAQGRRAWLEEHPPYRVGVCPWRPSFGGPAADLQGTGNGTPTQVYALFVWFAGHQGETVLEIIPGGEVEDGED